MVVKFIELLMSRAINPIYWRFFIYKMTSLIVSTVIALLLVRVAQDLDLADVDWMYVVPFIVITSCWSFFLSPISEFSINVQDGIASLRRQRKILRDVHGYEIRLVSIGTHFLKFKRRGVASYMPIFIYGKKSIDALSHELNNNPGE